MYTHKNILNTAQRSLLCLLLVVVIVHSSHVQEQEQQQQQQQSSLPLQPPQQEQEQNGSNELGNSRERGRSSDQDDSKLQFTMRILALFTGSSNDLGLDHRLGRQVLKLAADRARRLASGLTNVELIFHNDDTDCSDSANAGKVPLAVAQHFYLPQPQVADGQIGVSLSDLMTLNNLDEELEQDETNCQANGQLDECSSSSQSTSQVTDLRVHGKIDAILGPSCDHQIDQVARMAAYWRTPIYIVTPTSGLFARKDIYSTLTRLAPSIENLSLFMVKVLGHFKWRHLALVADMSQTENAILVKALDKTIDQMRYTIPVERKLFPIESGLLGNLGKQDGPDDAKTTTSCTLKARELLEGVRRVARVVLILLNDPKLVRQVLLCAHELHFNNGEFTFLTLNLGFKSTRQNETSKRTISANGRRQSAQVFDWFVQIDETNNLKARQMFESLMVFSVELPIEDEFNSFSEQVLEMARQQNQSSDQFDSIGPVAVALHDSLLLATEAKRRFLMGNNTNEMARLMWNQSYTSGLMSTLINANGDQELEYVLSDMEPELGIMRPVASYSKNEFGVGQLKLVANSYVHWPARISSAETLEAAEEGNSVSLLLAHSEEEPPPDEPECGFTGEAERCVDRRNMYTALTIVSLFLLAILTILLISLSRYKKIKYQMQLDDYWWRINWSELEFIDLHNNSLHSKLGSNSVILLKRKFDGAAASIISSGLHSLTSLTKQAPLQPVASSGAPLKVPEPNRSLSFIGEGIFKSIKRQEAEPSSKFSLVVTPAASGPDELKADERKRHQQGASNGTPPANSTKEDKLDRLSLTSAGSRTRQGKLHGPNSFRSDLSTVVRSSSLALFKDEVVIVKQLNGSSIEITRNLLIELKCIRELAHENLARLVGLCIERDHLASVYEYCSRGNLQDLLLNEDFPIDWDLKYSIIGDLLNGLNFIHTTLLDFHGRLKSTNLVIDSRFTVKLTDFGLKSLYNQLEFIEGDNESDDGNETQLSRTMGTDSKVLGSELDGSVGLHCDDLDAKLRRQSAVPTIYNMDSVSMQAENLTTPTFTGQSQQQQQHGADQTSGGISRMAMKNHSSARFFWTAPEHLRQRQPHLAASVKGDIYSLAIILYEIFTRKEPYYFGTNAKPHWKVIRQEKLRHRRMKPEQQQVIGFDENSAERMASRGNRRTSSQIRKEKGAQQTTQLSTAALSSTSTQMKPQSKVSILQRRKRRNQVASQRPLTPPSGQVSLDHESCCSEVSIGSATSVFEAPLPNVSRRLDCEKSVESVKRAIESGAEKSGPSAALPSHLLDSSKKSGLNTTSTSSGLAKAKSSIVSSRTSSTSHSRPRLRSGRSQESQNELAVVVDVEQDEETTDEIRNRDEVTKLDADEILDQLRMGVQPEPIRPYIPNFLLTDIEPKLIGLLRNCWHEQPSQRPNAGQVRNSMRKITKGATAKNYLDNLLDRLQTYANQLERIVDFRSADIVAEKMRTDELLYQLVPRFVADKLKQNEPIIPQLYEGVTIFFSDIVGFEKYASVMSPCELVDLLNNINSSFEEIISSFDVTKIEVILDQFLVAAGISFRQQEQATQRQAAGNGDIEQLVEVTDQQQQMAPGEVANNQSTKSRRGLLKSLRKTEGKMNKSSSLDEPKGRQQSKQNSLNDSRDRSKLEKNLTQDSVGNGQDSDLYKHSGAEQIARMALCIRDLVKSFHFRQNLNTYNSTATNADDANQAQSSIRTATGSNFVATSFNIRIGIHSGKVCAGIVGLKRPKFCLIGDAVNVASRMHTNSKANKIQISPDTRDLLKQVSSFNIIPRGQIEVKGKGLMETFWLESSF